ncbi:glycosyltransferase family 4 protein [Nocardioides sp. cx-169]|uniref:glycosyltransferase family 4 protein n=1 Tax=Nocardioides sp. cx-169 TaxID=2899080 RepID=UPI001E3E530C|nr:glycosyltransferase family 4 protein [Nocardioides sp. cx-169]MCD4536338.1 glycosyltransferase family 4 protein [Nocardioides sp. cx-169]
MTQRTVVMANPSADVYGADLQLLESVRAYRGRGWRVVVVTPSTGPLLPRLVDLGAEVELLPFPVLCRAALCPGGVAALVRGSHDALTRMRRLLERLQPDVLYVNTLTLPWWQLAGRMAGVPVLCHVHEAEARDPAWIRATLAAPLALADTVVANSRTTMDLTVRTAPYLRRRLRLVPNGVRGPGGHPVSHPRDGRFRMLVVGRLSPRKAPEVAIEAAALLRAAALPVELELCGTTGPGHEAYVEGLRRRAERPDLCGAVSFTGYQAPIWPALERADALVATSLGESFGNAVVEGQLAGRPVVASAVPGHLETVKDGVTGLLVPAQDPEALADAVARLLEAPELGRRLATQGLHEAEERFGVRRYGEEIASAVDDLVVRPGARGRRPALRR